MESKKILVTCNEFTDKMNEALHRDAKHEGMSFPYSEDGLVLFAPALSESARIALHKATFDEVSKHYTITYP
jgi:hypothetical protein